MAVLSECGRLWTPGEWALSRFRGTSECIGVDPASTQVEARIGKPWTGGRELMPPGWSAGMAPRRPEGRRELGGGPGGAPTPENLGLLHGRGRIAGNPVRGEGEAPAFGVALSMPPDSRCVQIVFRSTQKWATLCQHRRSYVYNGGAGCGTRTRTPSRTAHFECAAS